MICWPFWPLYFCCVRINLRVFKAFWDRVPNSGICFQDASPRNLICRVLNLTAEIPTAPIHLVYSWMYNSCLDWDLASGLDIHILQQTDEVMMGHHLVLLLAVKGLREAFPRKKQNFMKKFYKTVTPPRTAFMKSLFRNLTVFLVHLHF